MCKILSLLFLLLYRIFVEIYPPTYHLDLLLVIPFLLPKWNLLEFLLMLFFFYLFASAPFSFLNSLSKLLEICQLFSWFSLFLNSLSHIPIFGIMFPELFSSSLILTVPVSNLQLNPSKIKLDSSSLFHLNFTTLSLPRHEISVATLTYFPHIAYLASSHILSIFLVSSLLSRF